MKVNNLIRRLVYIFNIHAVSLIIYSFIQKTGSKQ